MSLFRREDSSYWWVDLTIGGQRVQKSSGTTSKKTAKEWHDRIAAQLWAQAKLGAKPSYTWEDAVKRYVSEVGSSPSIGSTQAHLRWLDSSLSGRTLASIDREMVDKIRAARVASKRRGADRPVSKTTVNRTLEVMRAVLRRAMEWEWIDRVPKMEMLAKEGRRVRWLSREEAARLLPLLPEHMRMMAEFSLETGLRRSNVTGLEWSQVDLVRRAAWIHPDQAKAGKAIAVPLSERAVEIIRSRMGQHLTRVFSYRGKPVRQTNTTTWRKALVKAGIGNFRWHDLRHTWASWHIQAGTPTAVLQELGGWASSEMVRRYAHLSSAHLAEWVDRLRDVCPTLKENAGMEPALSA